MTDPANMAFFPDDKRDAIAIVLDVLKNEMRRHSSPHLIAMVIMSDLADAGFSVTRT